MALSGTILNIVITLGIAVISLFILFLYLKIRRTKKSIVEETKNGIRISQCPDYFWKGYANIAPKKIKSPGSLGFTSISISYFIVVYYFTKIC